MFFGFASDVSRRRMSETDRLTIQRPHVVKRSHFLLNRSYIVAAVIAIALSWCGCCAAVCATLQPLVFILLMWLCMWHKSLRKYNDFGFCKSPSCNVHHSSSKTLVWKKIILEPMAKKMWKSTPCVDDVCIKNKFLYVSLSNQLAKVETVLKKIKLNY